MVRTTAIVSGTRKFGHVTTVLKDLRWIPVKSHLYLRDTILAFKGPLKYLVAKLHGCYPITISLPVSQKFFARFFRCRPGVADSSRLRCNKHKKNFSSTFLLISFLLYGYNMWVVPLFFKLECFAWKCCPRTDVSRKPQRWLHVDGGNLEKVTVQGVRLGIEISKMRRHKLKLVLRYHHLQTSKKILCPWLFDRSETLR